MCRDVSRRRLGRRRPRGIVEAVHRAGEPVDGLDVAIEHLRWSHRVHPVDHLGRRGHRVEAAEQLVGSPASPAVIDRVQNWFVVMRCMTTSWTDHPSQRVGAAHWSSSSEATMSASRRRCRTRGTDGSSIGTSMRRIGAPS